eukprot:8611720-Pyramimonas_sp.AAC.1
MNRFRLPPTPATGLRGFRSPASGATFSVPVPAPTHPPLARKHLGWRLRLRSASRYVFFQGLSRRVQELHERPGPRGSRLVNPPLLDLSGVA